VLVERTAEDVHEVWLHTRPNGGPRESACALNTGGCAGRVVQVRERTEYK
jgi:hypothetical protein